MHCCLETLLGRLPPMVPNAVANCAYQIAEFAVLFERSLISSDRAGPDVSFAWVFSCREANSSSFLSESGECWA